METFWAWVLDVAPRLAAGAAVTASFASIVWGFSALVRDRKLRQALVEGVLEGLGGPIGSGLRGVYYATANSGGAKGQTALDAPAAPVEHGPEAAQQAATSYHADLLKRYHDQGLTQSKVSFWFSIIFASIGFALIGGSTIAVFTTDLDWTKGALPLVAGTVMDAVAGLFFVQSNKARENMTAFFDRLRADNKFADAITLVEEIDDKKVAANLKAYLALHFAGVDVSLNSYRSVIGLPAALYEDRAAPDGTTLKKKRGASEAAD